LVDVGDVSISSEALSRRAGRFLALALATLAVSLPGCTGSPPGEHSHLDGADLVSGTSIPRHGVLIVPRAGGPAELRAVEDPTRVRWEGSVALPPSVEAHPLGRSVILRGPGGDIIQFTPSGEILRTLGSVPADAHWIASLGGGGAFVGSGSLLLIDDEWSRELDVRGSVLWAAPASSGRSVALTETPSGLALQVWEAGETDPSTSRPVDSRGPAILTGWGHEVVLPEGDGRVLVGHALPDLAPTERLKLDDPPLVLAASASEHRLFATFATRPRVVAIDRYGWRAAGSTRTADPIREVRPALAGSWLLFFDGSTVWSSVPGGSPAAIPTEWRGDLPFVLPDGRVLGIVGGVVRVFEADGAPAGAVETPGDSWWLPVRWRPRFATPDVRAPDTTRAAPDGGVEPAPSHQSVGLTTTGRVSGRTVALVDASRGAADRPADKPAANRGAVSATVPTGFYAVATSSRELQSLDGLRAALERSGYPTQVLPRVDEANELWYRLMVGPYGSRDEADQAAARLQRQRGISAWIHEVSGPTPGPGGP